MKPFAQLELQKTVINNLKYKHKFIKDPVKIKRSAEAINVLIDSVKMFESILLSKFKTDALDVLICYIIKDYFMRYSIEGSFKDGLPIHQSKNKLDFYLDYSSELAIKSLSSQMLGHIIEGKIEDNTDLLDLPKQDDIKEMIKEILMQFKTDIVWRK